MSSFKAIVLLAVVAVAFAEEQVRAKKDVLVASPYAALPVSYAYDDGSYYPGKYDRAAYLPYHAAVPAAVPAVSAAVPAVHAAYSAYPYAYSAYSAYPFRSIVY